MREPGEASWNTAAPFPLAMFPAKVQLLNAARLALQPRSYSYKCMQADCLLAFAPYSAVRVSLSYGVGCSFSSPARGGEIFRPKTMQPILTTLPLCSDTAEVVLREDFHGPSKVIWQRQPLLWRASEMQPGYFGQAGKNGGRGPASAQTLLTSCQEKTSVDLSARFGRCKCCSEVQPSQDGQVGSIGGRGPTSAQTRPRH